MTVPLPSRLVGYGAYNLCFDKWLGRRQSNSSDTDFFTTIRNYHYNRINLVKVICFRHHLAENLDPARAVPLYIHRSAPPPYPQIVINPAFLDNLDDLVVSAAQHNFWVQVCIFHYHAIATPDGAPNVAGAKRELPDPLPPELDQDRNLSPCARLKNFFNPRPANPEQLARQKELVHTIVDRLQYASNVIYEIGNELRTDGQGCMPNDNCALAEWLNIMGNQIIQVTGYPNMPFIGTSTGTQDGAPNSTPQSSNEEEVFQTCAKHFSPGFFDFHFGQWYSTNMGASLDSAISRSSMYKGRLTPLIINDDGAKTPKPNPSQADKLIMRLPENVEAWARAAFGKHLHYASKETYPNGSGLDFNTDILNRLNNAAATVP
ncbi:MAG TPA: hypothetical protein VK619_18185 [Pyrinomonadaceae bacterium]|nr:hypothetical protein [Pyrinomonadaceae bacterium]